MGVDTRQTILIADDEPLNIRVLAEALSPEYQVKIATSGKQALEVALGEAAPDLILLDVNMPDINGYEVCRQLKCNNQLRHVPVIFVTAQSALEDEAKGLELGASDYIAKPFYLPITLARIKNHLLLKRKTDLLEELVFIDGLTEIANRRQFDQSLKEEWLRCLRAKVPISLVIMDVDHFKAYNDYYGHAAGDKCLQRLASALVGATARPGDLIARYGGEEFAAILPDTDSEGARHMCRHFCSRVAALAIPHKASPVAPNVTLSAGACTAVPSNSFLSEKLLVMADEMLYESKSNGRNQFRVGQL